MATVKISKHITYKEGTHSNTATRRRMRNDPNEEELAAMKLVAKKIFEPLRIHFDAPIRIISFFRSAALNKTIGGSRTSQHCKGEAVDIEATGDITNKQLFDYIKDNLEFDQLIWEFGTSKNPDWIHVSFTSTKPNRKRILKAVKDGNPVYQVVEAGIEVEQPEEEGITKKKSKKGIVAVKTLLNVRKKPSTEAKMVGQLKNGKKIKIVGEENDWYNIKTSKYSGWVSAKYVKLYKKK
ncbi:MAG: SH3 domain-containing protein [Flavobacteriales bacterium]|nr:SH3 domain-containing protein [Flavobacteriales bacterium]